MEEKIATPVASMERIQVLDVIRGFALLGILVVNMALFSHPIGSRRTLSYLRPQPVHKEQPGQPRATAVA